MRLLLALCAVASAVEVTPIGKVIDLLNDMLEKGKQEKQAEEVAMAKFNEWCKNTIAQKSEDIQENEDQMDKLKGEIEGHEGAAKKLGLSIAQAQKDIESKTAEMAQDKALRAKQRKDYEAQHQDLSESVSALRRAIEVMKAQPKDIAGKDVSKVTLLQELSQKVPFATDKINAFLQQDPNNPNRQAYEFQSGKIVDFLENLYDKFVRERQELEVAESNQKSNYLTDRANNEGQVTLWTDQSESDQASKADHEAQSAEKLGDVKETEEANNNDKEYKQGSTALCQKKQDDFAARQQLRGEEIEALAEAIKILGSDAVKGHGEKHLPQLLQTSSEEPARQKVVAFLTARAQKLAAPALLSLSMRLSTGADPFRKVKELIEDLLMKLRKEAEEEATAKGECDASLAKNEATRKEKTTKIAEEIAEIDGLEALIASLKEQIDEHSRSIAELDKSMADATKLREEEKAKNQQTIAEAQESQAAVKQATELLKKFYAKAGAAVALTQQEPKKETEHGAIWGKETGIPEPFDDTPYKGQQAGNGGIIGFLDVIMTDFKRLEDDTTSDEKRAQKEYNTFMEDSTVNRKKHSTLLEQKTEKKNNSEESLADSKKEKDNLQSQLNDALEAYDALKPACVDSGINYQERVAQREDEIQSLREALQILDPSNRAVNA
jgi:uncharacterized protein YdaT